MRYEFRFDIYALFMLIGLFQGIYLAYFFLRKNNRNLSNNKYWGFLLITLTVLCSEILLNYTGVIVKLIWIENYSEPFIFLVPPLLYLAIKTGLGKQYSKDDWIHFFPFVLYLVYMGFYFIQPIEYKFNQYVYCYQPSWEYLETNSPIHSDPLELRDSLVQLYLSQFLVYGLLMFQLFKNNRPEQVNIPIKRYRILQAHWLHYLFIMVLILLVKVNFDRDLGDYIIGSYLALWTYLASFFVIRNINLTPAKAAPEPESKTKYEKSSLSESKKTELLEQIEQLFNTEKVHLNNNVSLSEIAKKLHAPTHHISQAINEGLNKSFFDLLSEYRIKEASLLLKDESKQNLTIEEIAEQVGYNSKAAFNKAFKKINNTTPSAYRKEG